MATTKAPAKVTVDKVRGAVTSEPQTGTEVARVAEVSPATARKALQLLASDGVVVQDTERRWVRIDLPTGSAPEAAAADVEEDIEPRVEVAASERMSKLADALQQAAPPKPGTVVINAKSRIIHLAECSWVTKNPDPYRAYTDQDAKDMGAELVATNACRRCKVADHLTKTGRVAK